MKIRVAMRNMGGGGSSDNTDWDIGKPFKYSMMQ